MKRNTVKPLHNGDLGDRRKWPLWRGGRYGRVGGNMAIFFRGVRHVYYAKFMFTIAQNAIVFFDTYLQCAVSQCAAE